MHAAGQLRSPSGLATTHEIAAAVRVTSVSLRDPPVCPGEGLLVGLVAAAGAGGPKEQDAVRALRPGIPLSLFPVGN